MKNAVISVLIGGHSSFRSGWSLLFTVLTALAVAGCATPHSEDAPHAVVPPKPGVLRVGVTPTMPPLIFKKGGQIIGLEADLARQLAANLGRTVEFVERDWDNLINALVEGRIDIIMSNLSITPARAMRVEFTQPYLRGGQTALVRGELVTTIRLKLYSPGLRTGVQKGTTGDFFVQQSMPRAKREEYRDARRGADAVLNGDVEVFVHDAAVNWWLASELESKGLAVAPGLLTEEYLAWGVRKDNTEMLQAANRFLDQARQSGELDRTIKRWIPQWR